MDMVPLARSPKTTGSGVGRVVSLLLGVGLMGFTFAACAEEPVEQTVAEMLAEIEGRELTPAEVAERQEIADFLCGVDDQVLRLMWEDMTRSQLEFQDFVFGQACRERSDVYAQATGRFSASDTSTPDTDSSTPTTATTVPNTIPKTTTTADAPIGGTLGGA